MLPNDDSYLGMYLGAPTSTQSASDAGGDLDSLAGLDLGHLDPAPSTNFDFVASPHFVNLTPASSPQSHEQLLYNAYTSQLFSQGSYQFSQPTTPANVPTPLNPFDFDPNMGINESYSPVMDYGSPFPNQSYASRNLPLIRLDTSFSAMGVSPAHLTGSSGTPSTFNTPIHPLRQISPFTSSPTSPLPPLNVSLVGPPFLG
jgi:hypothetical protein